MPSLLTCCKSFAPAIFATTAFVLGFVANFYCEAVRFPLDTRVGELAIHAGAWSYRTIASVEYQNETYYYNVCRSYKFLDDLNFDYSIDSKTRTVRAFAIIVVVLGVLGMVIGYCLPCTRHPDNTMWKVMGASFLMACLFQGITLIILRSSICLDNPLFQFINMVDPDVVERFPEECDPANGYNSNIAAVCLWFLAGAFTFLVSPPEESMLSPHDMHEDDYEDYADNDPDGNAEEAKPLPPIKGGEKVENEEPESEVEEGNEEVESKKTGTSQGG